MPNYNSGCKKGSRLLAAKYDRTDGSRFEHYGRKSVYAANEASEGQDHE